MGSWARAKRDTALGSLRLQHARARTHTSVQGGYQWGGALRSTYAHTSVQGRYQRVDGGEGRPSQHVHAHRSSASPLSGAAMRCCNAPVAHITHPSQHPPKVKRVKVAHREAHVLHAALLGLRLDGRDVKAEVCHVAVLLHSATHACMHALSRYRGSIRSSEGAPAALQHGATCCPQASGRA